MISAVAVPVGKTISMDIEGKVFKRFYCEYKSDLDMRFLRWDSVTNEKILPEFDQSLMELFKKRQSILGGKKRQTKKQKRRTGKKNKTTRRKVQRTRKARK